MTDRPTASTITDAQLTDLYDERDRLRDDIEECRAYEQDAHRRAADAAKSAMTTCATHDRLRKEAEERADQAEDLLRVAHDTSKKSEAERASAVKRAETADATVQRVTDLYERWVKAGAPPLGTSMSRWWDRRLAELHAALEPAKEQPDA